MSLLKKLIKIFNKKSVIKDDFNPEVTHWSHTHYASGGGNYTVVRRRK